MKTDQDLRQAERPAPPDKDPSVVWLVIIGLVVLALLALGAARLLGSGDPEIQSTGGPVTPATLSAPAPVPPALNTAGANPDWPALVDSFLAYQNWLFLHPAESARLVDLFTPDYRVVSPSGEVIDLASSKADLDLLARGDIRFDPAPVPSSTAAVTMQNRDTRSASVFVRFNPKPGNRTIGRDGQVKQYPDQAGAAVVWRMVLGDDGRWRLAGVKPA